MENEKKSLWRPVTAYCGIRRTHPKMGSVVGTHSTLAVLRVCGPCDLQHPWKGRRMCGADLAREERPFGVPRVFPVNARRTHPKMGSVVGTHSTLAVLRVCGPDVTCSIP